MKLHTLEKHIGKLIDEAINLDANSLEGIHGKKALSTLDGIDCLTLYLAGALTTDNANEERINKDLGKLRDKRSQVREVCSKAIIRYIANC